MVDGAGELAEGTLGQADFGFYFEENLPGVKIANELAQRYNRTEKEWQAFSYTMAGGEAMVAEEAVKLALENVGYEGLTGATVKEQGFEMVREFDTGGIRPLYTWEGNDRRGHDQVRMYQIKDGKTDFLTDYFTCPNLPPK